MPVTSSHSPALSLPCAISMSCTTMNTIGTLAASSHERFFGIGSASRASISENSANAPLQRPITRSPGLKPVTPSPTLATSPAPSPPAAFAGPPAFTAWPTISSPRFIPAACIFRRICPGPGVGSGTSRNSSAVFPASGFSQNDFISISSSIDFRADLFHELAVDGELAMHLGAELLGRRDPRLDAAGVRKLVPHVGQDEHLVGLLAQAREHGLGNAGRGEQAVPLHHHEIGIELRDRRHVGERARALRTG